MGHPLTGKNINIYITVWAILLLAHAAFLYLAYDFPLVIAVAESFTFNALIAGLGLSYWYVVQYLSPMYPGVTGTVLSHLLGVLVSVSLISYICFKILYQLFSANVFYTNFLSETMPWRIFVGVLYLTLIIMLYYLFLYNFDIKEKEKKGLQLQNMLKQSELEMLKFQINPHFIFNSLNSISSLTITSPDQARNMIVKLADFFRSTLGKGNQEVHTLEEELNLMNLYLDIEQVRFGDRLKVVTTLDEKSPKATLPNMILQPIYENAIKYGMYEQLEDVEIKTTGSYENGLLKISIANNYDPDGVPGKGNGIGLMNVSNRLAIIYGIPNLLSIEKKNNIFTVHLQVPQNQRL